jgi:MFS family permease
MKKGVSASVLGFVYSSYSFSMFLTSLMMGHIMNKFGRKKVLQVGCLMEVNLLLYFNVFDIRVSQF